MASSDLFGEAVRRAVGDRSLRETEELCCLDHTTIMRMMRGQLVRRETLAQFCQGLRVTGKSRERLFRLAGMVEFAPEADAEPCRR